MNRRQWIAAAASAALIPSALKPVRAQVGAEEVTDGFNVIRGFGGNVLAVRTAAGSVLVDSGADLVGSNCGNGVETMVELAREFAAHTRVPIVIQSNAGLPENRGGELHYPESPEFMAERVDALVDLGVAVIGGCCGTGPDHIRAIRAAIDHHRTAAS